MTANQLAVLVLWYGLAYAVLLHSNIWAGLGGLLIVALLAQGSHGDGGGMLVAYTLGLLARWFMGWRWRDKTSRTDSRKGYNHNYDAHGTHSAAGAGDGSRAEVERRRREEEAQQRWEWEDARRGQGHRGEQNEQPHQKSNQREQRETNRDGRENQEIYETQSDTRTPEEILGVCPGCTYEELKQAYRLQCQRLHTDRWQDRPPHLRAILEEEQKKVNMAFQILKKRFIG